MEALKRELQVLSEQYSQKCLEIGALTQQAEEREHTLRRCQQEGQELLRHNQVGLTQVWWEWAQWGKRPCPDRPSPPPPRSCTPACQRRSTGYAASSPLRATAVGAAMSGAPVSWK
jgi:hypothetical protein